MKLRTIIVDDEPLARERLRTFLQSDPEIEIIAECANGRDAASSISEEAPDLVFLDIQIPEFDGFAVLSKLDPTRLPAVIFVTAYDKFAVRAFEVHAVDYLLKPFDRQRFLKALEHAKAQLARHQTRELNQRVQDLLADLQSEKKSHLDRLAIKTSGRIAFLSTDEIDWVEAADNYVSVHTGPTTHLVRETMSSLESQLSPRNFVRISRSAIVNISKVKELQPMFHGEYSVILRNGTRLTLSRSYRNSLIRLTGKEED